MVMLVCSGCVSIGGPLGFIHTAVEPDSREPQCGSRASGWPRFEHVLIIVFENQNFYDVINHYQFQALAKEGATFTRFQGLFHPSYSNYLAMVSGRKIVTRFDSQVNADGPTIGDRLVAEKKTWKNYAEGYPKGLGCFNGDSHERYVRKHVPFMTFVNGKTECGSIVNAEEFEKDVQAGALPHYAFYSPDLDHDGHDPVRHPRTGLSKAARWLTSFLKQYRPSLKNTLIVVTFDESRNDDGEFKNHIYTVFLGDMVKPGEYDSPYNHYNVLATIADNFGVGRVGDGDSCARPIEGVWR